MNLSTPPRITDPQYLAAFRAALVQQDIPLEARWQAFCQRDRLPTVSFAFQVSAVYSSNIEGNRMDLNSFLRSRTRGEDHPRAREQAEIEALAGAYAFARRRVPSEPNALAAHRLLSRLLLAASQQGSYRTGRMFVYDREGIRYAAVEPEYVPAHMRTFFEDLATLRRQPLPLESVFYHAALLHLVFVHIHPFEDGNGRMARLLEKWFLTSHLGRCGWMLPSEAYYWHHRPAYYEALHLGPNFYLLDYARCIPFLTLLPQALPT
jgi:Fic family protein